MIVFYTCPFVANCAMLVSSLFEYLCLIKKQKYKRVWNILKKDGVFFFFLEFRI